MHQRSGCDITIGYEGHKQSGGVLGRCLYMFDSEQTKRLFLRYAIPCSEVLIKRGNVKSSTIEKIRAKLVQNESVDVDLEKIFTIAIRMLKILARQQKKKKIDVETIHEYFWFRHFQAIEQRNMIYKDIPVQRCIVWPGIVKKETVKTPLGEKKYKKDFVPDANPGDCVVVHYDYIVEKITQKQYDDILVFYTKDAAMKNVLKKFKSQG